MQRNAMSADFSWAESGRQYINVFRSVAHADVAHLFAAEAAPEHIETSAIMKVLSDPLESSAVMCTKVQTVKKKRTRDNAMKLSIAAPPVLVR
jgi:hypothetical protein